MNAQPIPISNINPLETAVADFIAAKRREDAANRERLEAEARILALQPAREEGATSVDVGGYVLTVTGKLTYSCDDLDAVREITRRWDGQLIPIKTTHALDATGCKYLRRERPDLWQQVAAAITVKPAKTAITVKV